MHIMSAARSAAHYRPALPTAVREFAGHAAYVVALAGPYAAAAVGTGITGAVVSTVLPDRPLFVLVAFVAAVVVGGLVWVGYHRRTSTRRSVNDVAWGLTDRALDWAGWPPVDAFEAGDDAVVVPEYLAKATNSPAELPAEPLAEMTSFDAFGGRYRWSPLDWESCASASLVRDGEGLWTWFGGALHAPDAVLVWRDSEGDRWAPVEGQSNPDLLQAIESDGVPVRWEGPGILRSDLARILGPLHGTFVRGGVR